MPTNQGRKMDQLLKDTNIGDLRRASEAMYIELGNHPSTSTCECPLIEALAVLYEQGYRLIKLVAPTGT